MKPYPEKLVIPKLSKTNAPSKLFFLDTETDALQGAGSTIKHVLKIGHVLYWRRAKKKVSEKIERYDFDNSFDLWQWIDERVKSRETVYIFAHNVTFDFLVLDGFRFLPLLDFKLKSIYSKFTTTVMRFANKKRRMVIADTMNYFPVTLAKLGTSVGIEKIETDFTKATKEELYKRCRADVDIIYFAVRRMLEETVLKGIGSFKLTASGLSHSIYRKKYMNNKIVVNHIPALVDFEKSAYIGGYTMVNNLVVSGKPELYKLDVNSMYPSVMLDNMFPSKLVEYADRVSRHDLERFVKGYAVVASVDLNTDEAIYPMKYKEATCYPLGEFTTTLSTPMIKYALERGHIKNVNKIAVYKQAELFKDFVADMYGERQISKEAGDTARELFYKTIINTLYGKFGQKRTQVKRIGDADINEFAVFDAYDPKSGEKWQEFHGGGSILFIYERGEARYTSYAIAAHITEYARLKLFQLRSKAGQDNIYYMDTDSLFTNSIGVKRLAAEMDQYKIGALKMEDRAPFFMGLAKKDYIFGDVRKIKGFDAKHRHDTETVFKAFNNVSLMGAARFDLRGGAFWREVNKRYSPYILDVKISDTGIVSPLMLPQDDQLLGKQVYTLQRSKQIAKKILTPMQKKLLSHHLDLRY